MSLFFQENWEYHQSILLLFLIIMIFIIINNKSFGVTKCFSQAYVKVKAPKVGCDKKIINSRRKRHNKPKESRSVPVIIRKVMDVCLIDDRKHQMYERNCVDMRLKKSEFFSIMITTIVQKEFQYFNIPPLIGTAYKPSNQNIQRSIVLAQVHRTSISNCWSSHSKRW